MAAIPLQPDCFLEGERVQIRPLRLADLPEMAAWEPHTAPLLRDYNLSISSPAGWRNWLQKRRRHRWLYAIRNQEGVLVGRLSLRHIDSPRSARLGITVAASYVNHGYGRAAMRAFLDYYFERLGFEEMRLDVSAVNLRARRLYQELGFRTLNSFWRTAPMDGDWAREKRYRRHFRRGKMRFYEMRLSAREWWRVRASLG